MIDRIIQINGKDIVIGQDLTLSHAGTVWDGALTLAYYWNKNQHIANDFLKDKKVLQLGSGTGIVGICATTFNTKAMYLTDLPQYIKILQINLQRNLNVPVTPHCIQVRKLEWENKQDMDAFTGSQLAYDKDNVIRLMNTIKHYKSINPKLKVMIAYQKYKQEWKNLQKKFAQYFPNEFKTVDWTQFDEDYRDHHIGILFIE